jgi:hypothetical protein
LQNGKLYMGTPAKAARAAANASSGAARSGGRSAIRIDLTSWYSICSISGTPAGALGGAGAPTVSSQRSTMGKPRQSQDNDQKRTSQRQGGKQELADSDKASSRTAAHNPQQQQNQDTGRSQLGSGDGAAPRAGSNRGADNPSLSANQEDRRGQQASRDSVESLQGEHDGGKDEKNSRQR